MIVPNETQPKTRNEKIFVAAVTITILAFITYMVGAPMIQVAQGINGKHLEYITSVEEHRLFITQSCDHSTDVLYGFYELADGVELPDYLVESGCGWVYVTLSWGTITKVEPYS